MQRTHVAAALVALSALALAAAPARAGQEWTPPSKQMPQMPAAAELDGGWKGSAGAWFGGTGVQLDQVRASGEGGARLRFVRFTVNMRPVEVWSDRNGDGRADLVEVFRDGGLTHRLVDSDYDGTANALRVYGAGGGLTREERY
jgi:hypothetical protein